MLSWLIETDVFQLPQLHKHFNVSRHPFGQWLRVQSGQNAEVLNWLEKGFTGQNAGTVLMDRPHKKSVKKILCRALRNEIDVTKV